MDSLRVSISRRGLMTSRVVRAGRACRSPEVDFAMPQESAAARFITRLTVRRVRRTAQLAMMLAIVVSSFLPANIVALEANSNLIAREGRAYDSPSALQWPGRAGILSGVGTHVGRCDHAPDS